MLILCILWGISMWWVYVFIYIYIFVYVEKYFLKLIHDVMISFHSSRDSISLHTRNWCNPLSWISRWQLALSDCWSIEGRVQQRTSAAFDFRLSSFFVTANVGSYGYRRLHICETISSASDYHTHIYHTSDRWPHYLIFISWLIVLPHLCRRETGTKCIANSLLCKTCNHFIVYRYSI